MWCLRYTQRTEVERRYTETWHNYMGIIFQSWATWARGRVGGGIFILLSFRSRGGTLESLVTSFC
ncbi:hypothetical protein DPMN_161968 [Dreissena polymorpha]|uniref:Uncharacterized protein n=1 Tax=Dreissena polymorpha TaxID=45954 RepID=A0A9D4ERF1_DREPO|nr:hypothetical protein DPMN_161968 [Dreissena polymorpha]